MSGAHGYSVVRATSASLRNGGAEWNTALLLSKPLVYCAAAVLHGFGLSIEARLTAALAAARCPHCAYAMHHALVPAGHGDFSKRLKECPECGYPWPLLPPPL
ncbi:MAG: hypothetical protein ACKVS8_10185 [Phycisphaerales bacterium]